MSGFMSGNPPSATEIDEALRDYGFNHTLSQAMRMYAEYVNKGLLGYAGGVLDQPDEYWQDISTMRWLALWVEHLEDMPRLEQNSVFDTIRSEGRLNGRFITDG